MGQLHFVSRYIAKNAVFNINDRHLPVGTFVKFSNVTVTYLTAKVSEFQIHVRYILDT